MFSQVIIMTDWNDFFKIMTYVVLIFLIVISSWTSKWHLEVEIAILVLILCGYTLLLVLPITKFKLGLSGFEGELGRLAKEAEALPKTESAKEVDQEVTRLSESLVDHDLVLMRLSIDIETTLKDIAETSGLRRTKVGMGRLIRMLRQKEVITDRWLLDALSFFQKHRNELIHEGTTTDLEKAISIGSSALAELKEIQRKQKISK